MEKTCKQHGFKKQTNTTHIGAPGIEKGEEGS